MTTDVSKLTYHSTKERFNAEQPQQHWLIGKKAVAEQLQSDPSRIEQVLLLKGRPSKQFREIMDLCHAHKIRSQWRDQRFFEEFGPAGKQGVAARLSATSYADEASLFANAQNAPLPVVVALDQVQDTHNVGTMVRSAWAMGAGGLLMPKHNAAHLGHGAARAAAGALHKLPIARCTNLSRSLEAAREQGWHAYALRKDDDALPLWNAPIQFPAIFVMGGEDKGVRPGVAKACDASLWIPMPREQESLNVAQAAAMALAVAAMRAPAS